MVRLFPWPFVASKHSYKIRYLKIMHRIDNLTAVSKGHLKVVFKSVLAQP